MLWQVHKNYIAEQPFLRNASDDCFCLEIWSRYHYNKKRHFKNILIWRSSRKMKRNKNLLILYYLWKNLSKFSNEQKKVFHAADSKFSFNVSLCKINCFKIQTINLASKSILAEVLCVLFTLTSSFDSDWKKTSS